MFFISTNDALRLIYDVIKNHELIWIGFKIQNIVHYIFVFPKKIPCVGIYPLLGVSLIKIVHIYFVFLIVLSLDAMRRSFYSQIEILSDEDHGFVNFFGIVEDYFEDFVVDVGRRFGVRCISVEFDLEFSSVREINLIVQPVFFPKRVNDATGFPRVEANNVISTLQPIKFLDDEDGNDHLVVLKRKYGFWIVSENVRVEKEDFFHKYLRKLI